MQRLAYGSLSFLFLLAACGDDGGDGNGGNVADAAVIDAAGDQVDAAATPDAAVADAMPSPDAQPSNLACAGDPLPTTAPAQVTVSGTVLTIQELGQVALADADLEARRASDDNVLATDTSAADGAYALTVDSGEMPLEGYVRATADGKLPTRVYPPVPVAGDEGDVPVLLITEDDEGALYSFSGLQQEAGKATVAVVLIDCDGNPIDGATLTSPTDVDVVYGGESFIPNAQATSTSPSGLVYLLNVEPGAIEVDAEVGDVSLREHTLEAVEGEFVTTGMVP